MPQRTETTDGFELQLGSNFLGPFALTVRETPACRSPHPPREWHHS
ncbi:hypothetical protein [Streptomyces sp. KL116D]